MKHITWPAVAVFIVVLAALATMFGLADDPAMRQQILRYFDSIVPFILGVGAGAAAGGATGFAGGFMRGQSAARADLRKAAELQPPPHDAVQPHADSIRRAAEVVRVATEESHLAAEDARATAAALHSAAEEGREVVELQRIVLAEIRRAAAAREHDGSPAPGMRSAVPAR